MISKRMIIMITVLLLVVIVPPLVLYVDYTRTISPRDIKIGKLIESIKSIKLDYDIKSVTVKCYQYKEIGMNLYFRDMLSNGTERDIFLDCARAILDPETLTLFKEKYLYRIDTSSELYDLNRQSYDSDGYPYFDIVICFFFFNDEDHLAYRFESIGGKGNENYDHWYYENTVTGESYSLTLSGS
jgi:hypothetical protein